MTFLHFFIAASKKTCMWLAGVILVLFLTIYALAVMDRLEADYINTSISTEDGGEYYVNYYSLRHNTIWVRLYRSKDHKLLAERTFDAYDAIKFYWLENMLIYDTNDPSIFYDGGIDLPPRWIDRFLTYVP